MAWVASFFLVGFLAGAFGAGVEAGFAAGAFRGAAGCFAAPALRVGAFRVSRRFGAASSGDFAPGVAVMAGSAFRAGTTSGELFGARGTAVAFAFRGPGTSFSFFRFGFSSMVLVPFGS